jgi:predicted alpha/beta hydrolase
MRRARAFQRDESRGSSAGVLTYDYRGVGRSRPRSLRGFAATLHDWAALDAAAAHAFVRTRFPGEPLAVIGHSFGGQLVGLIGDVQNDAAAVVMVGAQLAYYRDWPRRGQLRLAFVWRMLVPALNAVFGYVPGSFGLGEDLPRGAAAQWARWCLHPDYLISEYPDARARFAGFDRPTLFYSFTDDDIAPPGAVAHLLRRLNAARLDHVHVDSREHGGEPIGHFGFFRARFAPTLWQEAADFLRDALQGRTPRRERRPFTGERALRDAVTADGQLGRAS